MAQTTGRSVISSSATIAAPRPHPPNRKPPPAVMPATTGRRKPERGPGRTRGRERSGRPSAQDPRYGPAWPDARRCGCANISAMSDPPGRVTPARSSTPSGPASARRSRSWTPVWPPSRPASSTPSPSSTAEPARWRRPGGRRRRCPSAGCRSASRSWSRSSAGPGPRRPWSSRTGWRTWETTMMERVRASGAVPGRGDHRPASSAASTSASAKHQRRHPQPVAPRPHGGGLVGRQLLGRGRRPGDARHGGRRRRLDPHPGGLQRPGRHEGHLRPHPPGARHPHRPQHRRARLRGPVGARRRPLLRLLSPATTPTTRPASPRRRAGSGTSGPRTSRGARSSSPRRSAAFPLAPGVEASVLEGRRGAHRRPRHEAGRRRRSTSPSAWACRGPWATCLAAGRHRRPVARVRRGADRGAAPSASRLAWNTSTTSSWPPGASAARTEANEAMADAVRAGRLRHLRHEPRPRLPRRRGHAVDRAGRQDACGGWRPARRPSWRGGAWPCVHAASSARPGPAPPGGARCGPRPSSPTCWTWGR